MTLLPVKNRVGKRCAARKIKLMRTISIFPKLLTSLISDQSVGSSVPCAGCGKAQHGNHYQKRHLHCKHTILSAPQLKKAVGWGGFYTKNSEMLGKVPTEVLG